MESNWRLILKMYSITCARFLKALLFTEVRTMLLFVLLYCCVCQICCMYMSVTRLNNFSHVAVQMANFVCLFCLILSIPYPSICISLHYQPMAMQHL